jgi:hypothetical protein
MFKPARGEIINGASLHTLPRLLVGCPRREAVPVGSLSHAWDVSIKSRLQMHMAMD